MKTYLVTTEKNGEIASHQCEAISLGAAQRLEALCERKGYYVVLDVRENNGGKHV